MAKLDRLDLPALDAKWQRRWAERGTYRSDMEGPRPFYCLMMFPYPSAEKLHIGNAYAFTGRRHLRPLPPPEGG